MALRLYSIVAHHYLSPLQCGLQTAHVVAELSLYKSNTDQAQDFNAWAHTDKTIIILGAGNHAGVLDAYDTLQPLANQLGIPCAIFREDEQSMNGMATACGLVVEEELWAAQLNTDPVAGDRWEYIDANFNVTLYDAGSVKGQFIQKLKSYRLA